MRRKRASTTTLREHLAAKYRDLEARYAGWPGCPYGRQADRLAAGEAVTVAAWQVPEELRPFPADNYTLTVENTLEEVRSISNEEAAAVRAARRT